MNEFSNIFQDDLLEQIYCDYTNHRLIIRTDVGLLFRMDRMGVLVYNMQKATKALKLIMGSNLQQRIFL